MELICEVRNFLKQIFVSKHMLIEIGPIGACFLAVDEHGVGKMLIG